MLDYVNYCSLHWFSAFKQFCQKWHCYLDGDCTESINHLDNMDMVLILSIHEQWVSFHFLSCLIIFLLVIYHFHCAEIFKFISTQLSNQSVSTFSKILLVFFPYAFLKDVFIWNKKLHREGQRGRERSSNQLSSAETLLIAPVGPSQS